MTGWLNLALGLVGILNFIFKKFDEAQKLKVWEEVLKSEMGNYAEKIRSAANAARSESDAIPDSMLRDPDPNSRT